MTEKMRQVVQGTGLVFTAAVGQYPEDADLVFIQHRLELEDLAKLCLGEGVPSK